MSGELFSHNHWFPCACPHGDGHSSVSCLPFLFLRTTQWEPVEKACEWAQTSLVSRAPSWFELTHLPALGLCRWLKLKLISSSPPYLQTPLFPCPLSGDAVGESYLSLEDLIPFWNCGNLLLVISALWWLPDKLWLCSRLGWVTSVAVYILSRSGISTDYTSNP